MTKVISTILSLAMATTMSVTAFAESTTLTKDNTTKDIPVKAKYVDGQTAAPTVSADITWGAMEFTYSVGGTKKWDAKNHSYTVDNATATWSESGNTVKIVNHSNVDIKTTFEYTPDASSTLSGSFTYDNNKTADNDSVILTKGVENDADNADNVTATLTLSGTPDSNMSTFTGVGKVTVGIAQV